MARSFDGTDDVLKVSAGGVSGVTAPATFVALIKKNADGANGVWIRCHDNTDTFKSGLQVNTSNVLRYFGPSGTASSAFTVLASEGWLIVAGSKATGTATPRFHKCVMSTTTWTHSAGDISVSTHTAIGSGGTTWFGANNSGLFFNGEIAAAAVYDYVLSDAQTEFLAASYWHWLRYQPVAMWVFDQASISDDVLDMVGDADETAITGTAVTSSPERPLPAIRHCGVLGVG